MKVSDHPHLVKIGTQRQTELDVSGNPRAVWPSRVSCFRIPVGQKASCKQDEPKETQSGDCRCSVSISRSAGHYLPILRFCWEFDGNHWLPLLLPSPPSSSSFYSLSTASLSRLVLYGSWLVGWFVLLGDLQKPEGFFFIFIIVILSLPPPPSAVYALIHMRFAPRVRSLRIFLTEIQTTQRSNDVSRGGKRSFARPALTFLFYFLGKASDDHIYFTSSSNETKCLFELLDPSATFLCH